MLLKRFCDADGYIWVGDRHTGDVLSLRPANAFVETHQYTRYSYEDDSRDADYETRLGAIESAASPVLDRIALSVSMGRIPMLTDAERRAVKRFVFSLARRTPESRARIASTDDRDEVFYQAAQHRTAELGLPPLPPKEELLADDGIRVLADRVLHNVDAAFAAGDEAAIAAEEPKFIRETGLHYGTLTPSGPELIIGSHGIALHDAGTRNDEQPRFDGTVVPVTPFVLINVTGFPDDDYLSTLGPGTDAVVHSINRATVGLSQRIGGRSEAIVRLALERAEREPYSLPSRPESSRTGRLPLA